jgi:hypothetical protein
MLAFAYAEGEDAAPAADGDAAAADDSNITEQDFKDSDEFLKAIQGINESTVWVV